jgi:hypothetical protein
MTLKNIKLIGVTLQELNCQAFLIMGNSMYLKGDINIFHQG